MVRKPHHIRILITPSRNVKRVGEKFCDKNGKCPRGGGIFGFRAVARPENQSMKRKRVAQRVCLSPRISEQQPGTERSDRIAVENHSAALSGHCAAFPAAVFRLKTHSKFDSPFRMSLFAPRNGKQPIVPLAYASCSDFRDHLVIQRQTLRRRLAGKPPHRRVPRWD